MTDIPTLIADRIADAIATGGSATLHIEGEPPHRVTSLAIEDGLAVAQLVSTGTDAILLFRAADLRVAIVTAFEDPA